MARLHVRGRPALIPRLRREAFSSDNIGLRREPDKAADMVEADVVGYEPRAGFECEKNAVAGFEWAMKAAECGHAAAPHPANCNSHFATPLTVISLSQHIAQMLKTSVYIGKIFFIQHVALTAKN